MKDREKNFIFDGPFKEYCPMYVEYKRNLGYKFGESSLYQLRYMDDFFKNYDMALLRLNKDMVEDYVSKRGNESTKTQHMRMSLIRQFSIFMNSLGFNFYVHPKELIPIIKTFTPYIFTHKEIASIIKVLDSLDYTPCSKHYHLIYPMLFRMLYGCGLRINEALSLKKIDVDLVNGILNVKKAKNNTSRLVPMSTSLQNYCRQYASNMGFEMHDNGYFYPSRDNGKYNNTPVYVKFKHFMKKAGIFTDNEIGPRVHDIRHTFAVHALEKMVQDGQDIYCALPILCTYLGHRDIESTEKYLRLTEEAYGQIIDSVTPLYSGVFPEVKSMNSADFGSYLSKYFLEYITQRTGYSDNTIKSYRDTFTIYLRYCNEVLRIKPEKLCFSKISRKMVEEFLTWLEDTKNYSISTRNQRLAALHAFFRYLQIEAPQYMELCNSILSIRSKKTPVVEMNYLSITAIKELLATPDISSKEGRRDLAILSLLYDSGARVQELADVLVGDIRIKGSATIRLTGKGNKTRIIPIMPQTINIVKAYINDYGLFNELKISTPLFFNKKQGKLTRAGISYILNKYIETARKKCPDLFPNKVSPHIFRHSKAMHLLEGGVNLIYIRDFLGHSSVTTTEIYAKSNPEVKRKAIEQASHNVIPEEKFTRNEKDNLLNWLKEFI